MLHALGSTLRRRVRLGGSPVGASIPLWATLFFVRSFHGWVIQSGAVEAKVFTTVVLGNDEETWGT